MRRINFYMKTATESSVTDHTFKEIDKELSILNNETRAWLKNTILWHISEAYERGKNERNSIKS